ncbi:MAG: hypothetical protein ABIP55_10300 [Tepidisphaeraceae bacterium]
MGYRIKPIGRIACALIALLCAALPAAPARAEPKYEFALSLGYARETLDGSASPFNSRDGFRIEPRFTFGVSEEMPQLKLGVGLGLSGYSKSIDDDGDDFVVIDGEVFFINVDDVESLTLLTPEFQISWRQQLGADRRWFIEPGVAVGVVIGNYWVGNTWGWYSDEDINEWDATLSGRPFLRAGYQSDRWLVGLEASYLFGGDLNFTDDIAGNIQEFYGGAFFGFSW